MNVKYDKGIEKKNSQLGMPLGTASARLRKKVLFHLLKETGKNICFQCGKPIDNENELSIEHKIPYLDSDNPQKLFFDIENIAFSHLSCNVRAAKRPVVSIRETHQKRVKEGLHNLCKLTENDVNKIIELSKTLKGTEIAKIMNVSKHTIYRILNGKTMSYMRGEQVHREVS